MEGRITRLTSYFHKKNVMYLMSRDQRLYENYSVAFAYWKSYETSSSLFIAIDPSSIKANTRQKSFMYEGLVELEKECKEKNVHFRITNDYKSLVAEQEIDCIVLDYSPLREYIAQKESVRSFCEDKKISLFICDSHNIVPCQLLEVYKRTGKSVKMYLSKFSDEYLVEFKEVETHKYNDPLKVNQHVNIIPQNTEEKSKFRGGYSEGMKEVESFFKNRFHEFSALRGKADYNSLSNLSPWLHSGHISAQKVLLLAMSRFKKNDENLLSFINEMFHWREIAEHFCLHEPNYDNLSGALQWAQDSLNAHRQDVRSIYSLQDLENAQTDIEIWNCAQKELVLTGKMHGHIRMFWAKQLLKWTHSPEEALRIAILFNDKYSIDGNDPSGYLGVMWCICGSMDQGFKDRPITGKIRPMNPPKSPLYIKKWSRKAI
ncbi:Deoxyribodipyrimidine photo-lyase [Smittium mucronatum]|uniref:Deoxyribodipyrimidine photo-lyase n=1 Tax=Smittium mucronatum TaxID=133383 RepID=A0A1R0H1X4_9FUNG|nr:Deoxyribodipyrimidine photo-lyase [Smittium mucronatum]